MKIIRLAMACAIAALVIGADAAHAKNDNKGKGKKDNQVQADRSKYKDDKKGFDEDKPGKGAKTIPPGQIKRYTRGAKLPSDLDFEDIGDLDGWKLKAPGKGNRYIRVDDEILEVTEDLSTVVDAIGIVGDLLK